jgi:hypothetical protein
MCSGSTITALAVIKHAGKNCKLLHLHAANIPNALKSIPSLPSLTVILLAVYRRRMDLPPHLLPNFVEQCVRSHTILVLLGISLARDVLMLASAASLASAMLDVQE